MLMQAPPSNELFLSPLPPSSLPHTKRLFEYWKYLESKKASDFRQKVSKGGWGRSRISIMTPRGEISSSLGDTIGSSYKRFSAADAKKASTKHRIIELESKNPGILKASRPDGTLITSSSKYRPERNYGGFGTRNNIHTTKGKYTVKPIASRTPQNVDSGHWFSKAKKSKWLGLAITTAALAVTVNFLNSFADRTYGQIAPTAQSLGLWERESTYIPEKYSRGYDTIKQSMTDFGSRVNLSKTAHKVNVTPPNTVRQGMITTTGSITRSNLALQAHSNAINHTRY